MTQQIINIGTNPDDGTGDPFRTAFSKTNSNFTELYANKFDSANVDTDVALTANSDTKVASQKATKAYALPLSYLDIDGTLSANSDSRVPSQKAVKTYAVPLTYLDTDGTLAANSDSRIATQKATKTYALPLSYLDTDSALAANSDSKVASQKATKAYVDGKVAGLSWKQAVRAGTTANGALATAYANGQSIDGVTLATGDRILIKNQTTGSENGLYTVNASGAPTRATDADNGAELVNATVYISEGSTLADSQWTCTTNAPITVGSTSLTFTQINTSGYVLATDVHGATGKATPVDNDELPLIDSAASFGLKKLTWANLKATAKAYFDTLYGTVTSITASGGLQTTTGTPITGSGTVQAAHVINAQTGTSYAIASTDRGKHVTLSNASSIAVSIAQAGTTGFEDGYFTIVENIGAGAVTITPTTSTINGVSSLVLTTNTKALIFSDGSNYRSITINPHGVAVNAQTGTSYTVASGDAGSLVTYSNASAVAVALPQATGAFSKHWSFHENRGDGTVTITPTTSTIDGAASLALTTNQGCLIASDGSNYFTMRGIGLTNWTDSLHSASPNNTIPVAALTATNAATSVDVAIVPKGTDGALMSNIPDGTSAGGNKRGSQAVDWQIYRTAGADVASGSRSVIGGGGENRASGIYSVVAGGNNNRATGNSTFIGGGYNHTVSAGSGAILGGSNNTVAGLWGACVGGIDNNIAGLASVGAGWASKTLNDYSNNFSAGYFAAFGDAQEIRMVLRAGTTNATQTALTANQGVQALGNQLTLENNSAMTVKGQIIARQNSTGDAAAFEFSVLIKRGANAATTAIVGTPVVTQLYADSGATTWAIAISADTTYGALAVKFTGQASKTIRTVCTLTAVYVQG